MDDLDAVLTKLAQAPVPPALEAIEGRVMARIASRPTARAGLGIGALTVAFGLTMGVVAGGAAPTPAQGVSSLAPLGPGSPLAPSALLIGEP